MNTLKLTALTLLLTLSGTSVAQAVANAVVTAPGAQPMVMPLNVQMLPYGTVTIASGVYFIPNYENTGVSIYLQSPQPIRIATLEETVRYQAEWMRITQAINSGRQAATPAPQITAQPPMLSPVTSAATPVPTFPAQAAPAPAFPAQAAQAFAPQPTFPTQAASFPTQAPAAPAAQVPATFPTASNVFQASSTPTQAASFPAQPPTAPAAQVPATFPTASNVFQTASFPAASSVFNPSFPTAATAFPTPAPQASAPGTTLVPEYLRLNFRGRGSTVTYSLSNTSGTQAIQIEPNSLRAYQAGQPVQAQLAQRDSSGGTDGVLMPRTMIVGTINVLTRSVDPITITWQARDTQGRVYPISYAWMPQ